jgi:hypothetical protein
MMIVFLNVDCEWSKVGFHSNLGYKQSTFKETIIITTFYT